MQIKFSAQIRRSSVCFTLRRNRLERLAEHIACRHVELANALLSADIDALTHEAIAAVDAMRGSSGLRLVVKRGDPEPASPLFTVTEPTEPRMAN